MGNASYYEDIIERYQTELRAARTDLESVKRDIERGNEVEGRKRLASLSTNCARLETSLDKLSKSLSNLVEIATHPWVTVAQRYFQDFNRLRKLESDTREFILAKNKDKEDLEKAIAMKNHVEIELRTRIILLEDENKRLKRQNKTIKEEILYRRNPQALLGAVKPLKKK